MATATGEVVGNDKRTGVQPSGEDSYVSKLTTAGLGCQPKAILAPDAPAKIAIARLYGFATGVENQEDKEHPGSFWTFFKGNFEGINMQDGTVQKSGKLFLPKGVSEIVEQAVAAAKAKDKNAQVAFAFEVRVVKATNRAGYTYEAAALKDPHEEDAMSAMRGAVASLPTWEEKQNKNQLESGQKTPAKKSA